MKVLIGFSGVLGASIAFIGTALIRYEHQGDSNAWIRIAGKEMDVDVVGAIMLAIGFFFMAVSLIAIWRHKT